MNDRLYVRMQSAFCEFSSAMRNILEILLNNTNGGRRITEADRIQYLDALMKKSVWLSDCFEETAASEGIMLTKESLSSFRNMIIEGVIAVTEDALLELQNTEIVLRPETMH